MLGPFGGLRTAEEGLTDRGGVDVALNGDVLAIPLGEELEVVAAAVLAMADQEDAIGLVGGAEDLLLHLRQPEVVGVEVVAQGDELDALLHGIRQGGANHLLAFITAPGVAVIGSAAMAPQQDEQTIRLLQGGFDQVEMGPMKGLEPSDQDGNVVCHGDLRIPEMKCPPQRQVSN